MTGPGRRRQAALLAQHERRDARRRADRDAPERHARLRVGRGPRQRLPARRDSSGCRRRPSDVRRTHPRPRHDVRTGHRDAQPDALPARERRARVRRRHRAVVVGARRNHDRGSAAPDVRMQQATVNLFADMGVQPATLQAGLVAATRVDRHDAADLADHLAHGRRDASRAARPSTITGTATDSRRRGRRRRGLDRRRRDLAPRDRPRELELHVDAGRCRARRRSGAARSTTAATSRRRPGSRPSRSGAADAARARSGTTRSRRPTSIRPTTGAVELGVKFRSDAAGFITGIRFYKGPANTGTHVGHLWTTGGRLLGTATFTGETPTGWQQANFASPIPISANTTYVASYFTPVGQYAFNGDYFATAFDNPPLHALADGTDGPNGVYVYGASGVSRPRPSSKTNYWVDVVFATSGGPDTTPPIGRSRSRPSPARAAVAATSNVDGDLQRADGRRDRSRPPTFDAAATPGEALGRVDRHLRCRRRSRRPSIRPPHSRLDTPTRRRVKGGAAGVKDVRGQPARGRLHAGRSRRPGPPPPPPDQGPGGPILVVAGAEPVRPLLRRDPARRGTERVRRQGHLAPSTPPRLDGYDVVILGETPLTRRPGHDVLGLGHRRAAT